MTVNLCSTCALPPDSCLDAAAIGMPPRLLSCPPRGDTDRRMTDVHLHATHPDLIKRLKRAHGHLRHVIEMLEAGRTCADIATQMLAVERAVMAAKRTLIHDHIDNCLGKGGGGDLAELRVLAKLL